MMEVEPKRDVLQQVVVVKGPREQQPPNLLADLVISFGYVTPAQEQATRAQSEKSSSSTSASPTAGARTLTKQKIDDGTEQRVDPRCLLPGEEVTTEKQMQQARANGRCSAASATAGL